LAQFLQILNWESVYPQFVFQFQLFQRMAGSIPMNKIVHLLKRIQLRQIMAAFMAGALLVISTACSSGKVEAQTPITGSRQDVPAGLQAVPGKKNPRPEVPEKAETNKFEGSSMNEFSDVDPRAKQLEEATQAKAQELKENAERNIIDQTGSLSGNTKRTLDKKGENLADFGKNVQQNAGETKDKAQRSLSNFTKGTQQGTENIKDNTLDAVSDVTKGTARTIDANTPDTDELAGRAKQASRNAAENTKAAGKDAQNKLGQAAQGVRDALNKTGDAINDAVD
jgi:dGTP triphosphohydrolase